MNDHQLHSHLKTQVRSKSGKLISTEQPYKKISEEIFRETKNYVSESTLRRFFEAESITGFPAYVLNSLVQYLGFSQWEAFSEGIEQTNPFDPSSPIR